LLQLVVTTSATLFTAVQRCQDLHAMSFDFELTRATSDLPVRSSSTTSAMWIVELLCFLFEMANLPRFFCCVLGSLALVGIVFWLVPSHAVRIAVCVPVVVVGISGGLVWEVREK